MRREGLRAPTCAEVRMPSNSGESPRRPSTSPSETSQLLTHDQTAPLAAGHGEGGMDIGEGGEAKRSEQRLGQLVGIERRDLTRGRKRFLEYTPRSGAEGLRGCLRRVLRRGGRGSRRSRSRARGRLRLADFDPRSAGPAHAAEAAPGARARRASRGHRAAPPVVRRLALDDRDLRTRDGSSRRPRALAPQRPCWVPLTSHRVIRSRCRTGACRAEPLAVHSCRAPDAGPRRVGRLWPRLMSRRDRHKRRRIAATL